MWGNWGSESWNSLPNVTQLLSGGTEKPKIYPKNKNQVSSVPEPKRKKKIFTDKAVII